MSPKKTPPSEPFETFPKPCRRPLFEASAEAPAGPPFGERHLSRKPFLRKPLSTRLRTKPFGPSFGTHHVSRGLSRKTPSKTTYVPEYPAPGGFPPDVARVCHLSPSAERKPFLREPSEPPRVPRLPNTSRKPECADRKSVV